MFGIDFSEMMVIMLVALVVIGPERMPKVARTMGNLWARAQRFANTVKSDISRDIAIEDYRKLQQDIQEQASSLQQTLQEGAQGVTQEVHKLNEEVQQSASTADTKDNLPARSVPAGAAPRKVNLCALVDKAMAAGVELEDEPEFLTLSEAEQESARKLRAQEEKVRSIINKAHEDVERSKKLAALEEAKAQARAKAQQQAKVQEQQNTAGQSISQTLPQPATEAKQADGVALAQPQGIQPDLPDQNKFLVD